MRSVHNSAGSVGDAPRLTKFASTNYQPGLTTFTLHIYSGFTVNPAEEPACADYLITLLTEGFQRVGSEYRSLQVIIHLSNFSLSTVRIRFMVSIIQLYQTRYPQSLAQCYLLDAPGIFKTVYTLISTIVTKSLRDRIQFVSSTDNNLILNSPTSQLPN